MNNIPPKRGDGLCSLCVRKEAVSREGFCLPCLRAKIRELPGNAGNTMPTYCRPESRHGTGMGGDTSGSQENAIRVMEGD